MAITVTQLTAFLAVIRGGSVTAAADELWARASTVSGGCPCFHADGNQYRYRDSNPGFRRERAAS
jgi:hypothetical protein